MAHEGTPYRRKYPIPRVAKGASDGLRPGTLGITIRLPPDMFEAIRGYALAHQTTFADAMRILLETGLEEHGIDY